MNILLTLILYVANRVKEPSTHGGLSMLLMIASQKWPQYADAINTGAAFFASLCVALVERGKPATAPTLAPVEERNITNYMRSLAIVAGASALFILGFSSGDASASSPESVTNNVTGWAIINTVFSAACLGALLRYESRLTALETNVNLILDDKIKH